MVLHTIYSYARKLIRLIVIGLVLSQDMEIYNVNKFGFKNFNPSIIIDENSLTGDYEVYSVNKFGLKQINPDEIIESDKFNRHSLKHTW